MLCLWSCPPGFNCWIFYSGIQSYVLLCSLCFISILYLDLYVLDGTSMSEGSFMQTKHLFDLIHIKIRVRLVPSNVLKSKSILMTVPRRCFFCGYFLLSCLFLVEFWSPAGKGLTSWLSYMLYFLEFCHFPIWCPGSGFVFDCIYF